MPVKISIAALTLALAATLALQLTRHLRPRPKKDSHYPENPKQNSGVSTSCIENDVAQRITFR